ncbi:hypothetical protein HanRHA438_Chr16g0766271 [Helianthus annuus]|nr:hypothetical protein HanRHA438_Chr16g0766271 [Helianthus annuus]
MYVVNFVNPSFPLTDGFDLLLASPVHSGEQFGFCDVHAWPVNARLSAESGDV